MSQQLKCVCISHSEDLCLFSSSHMSSKQLTLTLSYNPAPEGSDTPGLSRCLHVDTHTHTHTHTHACASSAEVYPALHGVQWFLVLLYLFLVLWSLKALPTHPFTADIYAPFLKCHWRGTKAWVLCDRRFTANDLVALPVLLYLILAQFFLVHLEIFAIRHFVCLIYQNWNVYNQQKLSNVPNLCE